MLKRGGIQVRLYESLFEKNTKTQDCIVIEGVCRAGLILLTKDESIEADWIDDIIAYKAKVLVLTDGHGNTTHWASALIASESAWDRALLNNRVGPLVIRINRQGIGKVEFESDLRRLRERLRTARIVRAKRTVVIYPKTGTAEATSPRNPNPHPARQPRLF